MKRYSPQGSDLLNSSKKRIRHKHQRIYIKEIFPNECTGTYIYSYCTMNIYKMARTPYNVYTAKPKCKYSNKYYLSEINTI